MVKVKIIPTLKSAVNKLDGLCNVVEPAMSKDELATFEIAIGEVNNVINNLEAMAVQIDGITSWRKTKRERR